MLAILSWSNILGGFVKLLTNLRSYTQLDHKHSEHPRLLPNTSAVSATREELRNGRGCFGRITKSFALVLRNAARWPR